MGPSDFQEWLKRRAASSPVTPTLAMVAPQQPSVDPSLLPSRPPATVGSLEASVDSPPAASGINPIVAEYLEQARAEQEASQMRADEAKRNAESVRQEAAVGRGLDTIIAGLGGIKANSEPFDQRVKVAQNEADAAQKSSQDMLRAYLREKYGAAMGAEKSALDERKFKADQDYRNRDLKIKERATQQKLEGPNVAETAVDKDYAKLYNTWTDKGRNNAANAIKKLSALATEMESDTGMLQSGGGRFAAELPDWARSRDAIRRRDDTRNAANITLKELFGGQLSDAEREAAAKEYYNDALSNEENAKILRRKIRDLQDNFNSQEQKAKYFEKNRSLRGYKSSPVTNDEPAQTKVVGGKTYVKVPGGWKLQ